MPIYVFFSLEHQRAHTLLHETEPLCILIILSSFINILFPDVFIVYIKNPLILALPHVSDFTRISRAQVMSKGSHSTLPKCLPNISDQFTIPVVEAPGLMASLPALRCCCLFVF